MTKDDREGGNRKKDDLKRHTHNEKREFICDDMRHAYFSPSCPSSFRLFVCVFKDR